jgi:RimJ/RimL family protein N-acetyltransferase
MHPLIETERLRLSNWSLTDCPRMHRICSDPQVMRFVDHGQTWSAQRTRQFVDREMACAQQHGYCRWAVHHKQDCVLIGFTGFVPAVDGVEIGWRLAADYWGRGLATEAAKTALRYAMETLNVARISATVQSQNLASIRVIEKAGMQQVSEFQRGHRRLLRYSTSRFDAACDHTHLANG